jgi:hypothetical protein
VAVLFIYDGSNVHTLWCDAKGAVEHENKRLGAVVSVEGVTGLEGWWGEGINPKRQP